MTNGGNWFELGKQFEGLTIKEVRKLAEDGNPDAATYIKADAKFNLDVGYMLSRNFAESNTAVTVKDPTISRYIKYFYSRRMLFYLTRWHSPDRNPVNNIEYLYNQRKFIYYLVNEQMQVYKPTTNLYYFYTRVFPAALFLALADHTNVDDVIINNDIAQRLLSPIRAEIERDLLDGITTDQEEQWSFQREWRSFAEEPECYDDEEPEVGLLTLYRELSRPTAEAAIYYAVQNIQQPGEGKLKANRAIRKGLQFGQSAAINGYKEEDYNPRLDEILNAISEWSKLDQFLILHTWEYGELRHLAKYLGKKESTLQSRKSRLIAKLKKKFTN